MQCSVRARTGGLMFSVRLDARPCLKGTSALLPSIATWCGASIRFPEEHYECWVCDYDLCIECGECES